MASALRERAVETTEEVFEAGDCPECDGQIIADGSEDVCEECGLVVDEDHLDRGPEWRSFEGDTGESRSRVGSPRTITLHDGGLGSQISNSLEDDDMHRLRTWHDRVRYSQSHKKRNLKDALGQISRVVDVLDLSHVVQERASKHFREAHDANLLYGGCLDAGAAACVLIATRECRLGVSIADVREVALNEHVGFHSTFLKIQRELGVEVPPPQPADSLPRVAGDLGVPEGVKREAEEIIETFEEHCQTAGKDPRGIVGMALYVASQRADAVALTQGPVADAAGVSTVTLRNRLREFEEVSDA